MIVISTYSIVLTLFLLANVIYGIALLLKIFAVNEMEFTEATPKRFISILIPFRNEFSNLKKLIDSILSIDYPLEQFEVIFIDDLSDDNGAMEIQRLMSGEHVKFQVIRNSTEYPGKKSAIELGIIHAKGQFIATTDADCQIDSSWLSVIDNYFQLGYHFLIGFVDYRLDGSLLSMLQWVEVNAINTLNLGAKRPLFCNGANLAYRKSDFQSLGGYRDNRQIPSGDDTFLLDAFIHKFGTDKIAYLTTSSVKTEFEINTKAILNQKIRWASKWKMSGAKVLKIWAVGIFMYYLILLCTTPYLIIKAWDWVVMAFLMKLYVDYKMVQKSPTFKVFSVYKFIVCQFIYPLYVTFFSIASNFGKYNWKGRIQ